MHQVVHMAVFMARKDDRIDGLQYMFCQIKQVLLYLTDKQINMNLYMIFKIPV